MKIQEEAPALSALTSIFRHNFYLTFSPFFKKLAAPRPLCQGCINPDGSQLRYRYDNAHLLVKTLADGEQVHYAYDALGQLSHCRLPDGSQLDYRHQRGAPSPPSTSTASL